MPVFRVCFGWRMLRDRVYILVSRSPDKHRRAVGRRTALLGDAAKTSGGKVILEPGVTYLVTCPAALCPPDRNLAEHTAPETLKDELRGYSVSFSHGVQRDAATQDYITISTDKVVNLVSYKEAVGGNSFQCFHNGGIVAGSDNPEPYGSSCRLGMKFVIQHQNFFADPINLPIPHSANDWPINICASRRPNSVQPYVDRPRFESGRKKIFNLRVGGENEKAFNTENGNAYIIRSVSITHSNIP